MKPLTLEEMLKRWERTTENLSGNLTTNTYLPEKIRKKLLEEDTTLIGMLSFEDMSFPYPCKELTDTEGMNILSGLQKNGLKGYLTVFRAIRFPTAKRIWDTIHEKGFSMSNYEQERILTLYQDSSYNLAREKIQENKTFWIQPQERVVHGLPVFSLVNDALQIHHAYKNSIDKTLIIVAHIPFALIKNKIISLVANTAIDFDYNNDQRDYEITDFLNKRGNYTIDYQALRAKGIDLHEMYIKNLPCSLEEHRTLGIKQQFYLLDTYAINPDDERIREVRDNSELVKENEWFLHGFFGDNNIFGRRPAKYVPFSCQEVKPKHE